jgi:tetratricopeptide (TPR) repeat protein
VTLTQSLFKPTITEFIMKKFTFKQLAALPLLCFALFGTATAADTPSETPVAQATDEMAAGRQAVKDQKWTQAIASFKKAIAENPKNADAHNMLGYSHRALGKFDEAFAAYDKALALDPKHKGALEYSGMGYLKTNQKAKAEAQLAKLKAVCASCPETASLAKAVADYKPGAVISTY